MFNKKYPWALMLLLAVCAFLPAAALAATVQVSSANELKQISSNAVGGYTYPGVVVELTCDITLNGA